MQRASRRIRGRPIFVIKEENPMLKKLSIIAFTVLLAASFASASSKSTTPKIEGTIQKIDTATHTITVEVGTETKTFHYSDKTQFRASGKTTKVMDFKTGEKISIYADSKNFAKKIEMEAAKTN